MAQEGAGAGTVVALTEATARYGNREVWSGLSLSVGAGEFLAVLGPNGAGKTTLLNVLLGLLPLAAGSVEVGGQPVRRGSRAIGYVPQQRAFDRDLPIRGRDLVRLGLDGHRFGFPFARRSPGRKVRAALEAVGAAGYADAPIGRLSGGEQQRLRIAQAMVGEPAVLLCDEPLLSLDPSHQAAVTELLDRRRREAGTAVVFVTHEINPVLPYVDRVLYLVDGRWAVGRAQEVLTSERLSALYRTRIEVVHAGGRVLVAGAEHAGPADDVHHHLPHVPA